MTVVPWFSNTPPYAEDKMNINRKRNINNTRKPDYNCGGYAFGTFNWYLPFRNEAEHIEIDFECWSDALEYTEVCVNAMLEEFHHRNLRVIERVEELRQDEYAIAFRISSDGDFHYVRRHTTGVWFHKQGACSEIKVMRKEEVFSEEWCGRYDGPLVLMAIHRQKWREFFSISFSKKS